MINTYEIIEKIKKIKLLYIIGINVYIFLIGIISYDFNGYIILVLWLLGMLTGCLFITWHAKNIPYLEVIITLFLQLKFGKIISETQKGNYLPIIIGGLVIISTILGCYIGLIIANKLKNRK